MHLLLISRKLEFFLRHYTTSFSLATNPLFSHPNPTPLLTFFLETHQSDRTWFIYCLYSNNICHRIDAGRFREHMISGNEWLLHPGLQTMQYRKGELCSSEGGGEAKCHLTRIVRKHPALRLTACLGAFNLFSLADARRWSYGAVEQVAPVRR